jgi:quinol monooxygenase YgiN
VYKSVSTRSARAREAQAATPAEPGCIDCDFLTCSDDPDGLVFVESWRSIGEVSRKRPIEGRVRA